VLVITPTLADKEPQVRVGSRVTLRIDKRDSSWMVVGRAREVGSGPTAYAPYGHVSGTARLAGLANDVRITSDRSDPASTRASQQSAQSRLEDAGMRVLSAQTVASSRQVLINHVAITLTFLMLVSVLSSVVGAMGLASTMSINVIERTREIGVMRALGATTHAVVKIVVLEGVLISVASWVFAMVLSVPLSRLTGAVPAAVFIRAPLDEVISPTGIWLWLAIVVVVGISASLSPAWRASRAPVPETLAYE
jgi:putative ABC transport system permease protein